MARVFFLSLILLAISVSTQAFHVETISFDEGYKHLFGEDNMVKTADGRGVNLVLNRYTGTYVFHDRIIYDHLIVLQGIIYISI